MSSLRSLPLDGNPLKSIRREVVAGPISQLLKHLASRQAGEEGAPPPGGPPGRLGSMNQGAARSGNGGCQGAMGVRELWVRAAAGACETACVRV
mgnify:CR=1 FL=1